MTNPFHEIATMGMDNMYLGAGPVIFDNARKLRNNPTETENLLLSRLANNQLGVRFRRQHPILTYVADFYCHACKLVVELDGAVHQSAWMKTNDSHRTKALNFYGIHLIRFSNAHVISDIEDVVEAIAKEIALRRCERKLTCQVRCKPPSSTK